ncbi:heat-shock protein [Bacteroidia bacterium]|jgi:HSP20 family protein|nr:Hsp20/alpha crystallin family protein [Prevotellaceae bacterium]GHT32349.1 heat-shock protein [Bacteroidia bacterium]GHT56968.1 heat-shock protein [Bacteroidia bacterium]
MIIRKAQWLPEILLGDFYGQKPAAAGVSPSTNIVETDNGFRVELAVPGVAKEDIKVDINKDNELVVSASKKSETEEKQENYLRKEFSFLEFEKTLTLPEDADKDAISASYNHGVLNIEIPKKAKTEEEVKSIAIA